MKATLLDHSSQAFRGYLQRPIPDRSDEEVDGVLARALQVSESDREALRSVASLQDSQVFNAFAQRAAVRAVRAHDPGLLQRGLLALAFAGALDYRENLMVLALLSHSAQILGGSLDTVIESSAAILPVDARDRFRDFATWPEADKAIRAMGFAEEGSGDDFVYVRASPWS